MVKSVMIYGDINFNFQVGKKRSVGGIHVINHVSKSLHYFQGSKAKFGRNTITKTQHIEEQDSKFGPNFSDYY